MSRNRMLEQARDRLDAQLAKKPDDPGLLQMRAKAAERLGEHEDAAGFWQRAARGLRLAGDRPGEAVASLEAASAFARAGQLAKARNFFQRAVANAELLGDAPVLARARLAHARHHVDLREDTEARPLLERLLGPLADIEAFDDLAWAHGELARILEQDAGAEAALAHARGAVEAAARGKDRTGFGERLSALARLHLACGGLAKARSYQEKALPYLKGAHQRPALIEACRRLAEIAITGEDWSGAERFLVEAVLAVDAARDLPQQAKLRVELARVVRRRDVARARTLLEQAIERFRRVADPQGAAAAWAEIGEYLAETDAKGSANAFRRAADLYDRIGETDRARQLAERGAALGEQVSGR